MKRGDQIKLVLLVQVVGVLLIAAWYFLSARRAEPEQILPELMEVVRARGPASAVGALGSDVLEGGLRACRREKCISERFQNDSAQWAFKISATGVDPCRDFKHPACSESRTREILRHIENVGCELEAAQLTGPRRGLRVRCGGVKDFVPLERGPTGWSVAPTERPPGFLPNVHLAVIGG